MGFVIVPGRSLGIENLAGKPLPAAPMVHLILKFCNCFERFFADIPKHTGAIVCSRHVDRHSVAIRAVLLAERTTHSVPK